MYSQTRLRRRSGGPHQCPQRSCADIRRCEAPKPTAPPRLSRRGARHNGHAGVQLFRNSEGDGAVPFPDYRVTVRIRRRIKACVSQQRIADGQLQIGAIGRPIRLTSRDRTVCPHGELEAYRSLPPLTQGAFGIDEVGKPLRGIADRARVGRKVFGFAIRPPALPRQRCLHYRFLRPWRCRGSRRDLSEPP